MKTGEKSCSKVKRNQHEYEILRGKTENKKKKKKHKKKTKKKVKERK